MIDTFTPFANEVDSMQIGDMTIENGEDRISIYGAVHITKDAAGRKLVVELMNLFTAIVREI